MATIIDVAKLADVSKSTVSRVVSGKGYVSEESRTKVLEAVKELGYTPNLVARQLQSGQTRTILFVAHSFFDALTIILSNMIEIAKKHDYYITIFFTDGNPEKELQALNQLKFKQVDGLFIATKTNDWELIEEYSAYGPIATWHRIDSTKIYSSYIDHYIGYRRSLDYLYGLGYRNIGHLLGNPKNLNTQARLRAINDFRFERGIEKEPVIYYSPRNEMSMKKVAKEWLSSTDRLDAFAFYMDIGAAEFLSELQHLSDERPAIIGFDNSDISRLMHITTVDYSLGKQAENSFIYLYNQLNKDKQLKENKIEVKLVERKTTPKKIRT